MRTDYDPPDMKLPQYQHFFAENTPFAEGLEDKELSEMIKDRFQARQNAEDIKVENLLQRTYGPN